jgi:hypothetical protein
MPTKYLYIFSYKTPEQSHAVPAETVEESCEACFIEADCPENALAWGREVSEAYVRKLFKDESISWKTAGYAHWVESEPQNEYPHDLLAGLPVVSCGDHPRFASLQTNGAPL